jgi:RNA polymerase sigma-70 factor (ECF subfamily)
MALAASRIERVLAEQVHYSPRGLPNIRGGWVSAESNATKEGIGGMNAFISSANNSVIRSSLNKMSDALFRLGCEIWGRVAFVEPSTRHSDMILRRTYRIVKNWQDAEDVLQDSFMKAFIHLKDFEERSSFSSWLTRIAINSALMLLRKKRFHIEISTGSNDDDCEIRDRWELRDRAESPESRCARREREELLKGAIQGLPPILRDIVQLSHGEDRSMEEISQLLRISVPAAKSRLARARSALRIALVGAKLKPAASVGCSESK